MCVFYVFFARWLICIIFWCLSIPILPFYVCMLQASVYNFSSMALQKDRLAQKIRAKKEKKREKKKSFRFCHGAFYINKAWHFEWQPIFFHRKHVSLLLISQLIIMRNNNEWYLCAIVCLHSSCNKRWEIDHTSVLNRQQGTIARRGRKKSTNSVQTETSIAQSLKQIWMDRKNM